MKKIDELIVRLRQQAANLFNKEYIKVKYKKNTDFVKKQL